MTPVDYAFFSQRLGAELRDAGIREADQNADPEWRELALLAVYQCARERAHFTTDDVWEKLHRWNIHTHENRAMGAIMRRAADMGWSDSTSYTAPTERPKAHRRPLRVWESLIYLRT